MDATVVAPQVAEDPDVKTEITFREFDVNEVISIAGPDVANLAELDPTSSVTKVEPAAENVSNILPLPTGIFARKT